MADAALRFDFLARDRASTTFDKLSRKSDSLGSKMAGVGKRIGLAVGVVAAGGVAALGAALLEGGKAAARYEVLAKKSAAVIKSTGNVAGISVKGIQRLAGELESLSGVDEELIINSENVLATFTKIRNVGKNRIFDLATKSALDMSVALGTDLKGASILVGKALNDPVKGLTALGRAGVSFTTAQKDQIKALVKSGDTIAAQKIILRELAVEFGGAAKAAGNTFTGKIERAKDAVSDFARDLGTKALPRLGELADWVTTKGVPKLREFSEWLSTKGVPKLAEGVRQARDKLKTIADRLDLSGVGARLAAQAKSWGSDIIGGIRIGLETGDWSQLGRTLGEKIADALTGATDLAGKIGKALKKWADTVDWWEVGHAVAAQAQSFGTGFLVGLFDSLISGEANSFMQKHWKATLGALITFIPIGSGGSIAGRILARLGLRDSFLVRPIVNMLEKGMGKLASGIANVTRFMGRKFVEGFDETFPRVDGRARGFVTDLAGRIRGLADRVTGAISDVFGAIPKAIGRVAGQVTLALRTKGRELVDGIRAGISSRFSGPVGKLRELIRGMIEPFYRSGVWLKSAGGRLISGLKSGVTTAMRGIGTWVRDNLVNPIIRAVKSHFGIKSPSRVMMGIGGHLMSGLLKGMLRSNPKAIVGRVFGGMPSALGAMVDKGLVSLRQLPAKAWDALSGLGGKFTRMFGGGGASGPNQRLGQALAARFGWTGGQWGALRTLWQNESGWNNNAQNPTSTAFGIPQFLDSTWSTVGARKTSDPGGQILAGMKYIAQRYGTPASALGAWMSRRPHWYADGGEIREPVIGVGMRSGRGYGFGERGVETVIPGRLRGGGLRGGRGGDIHVHFHGSVITTRQAAEDLVVQGTRDAQRKRRL